jgi:hypothetical protein
MVSDRGQRSRLARADDLSRKAKISGARDLIYRQNSAVNSAPVEQLLRPQSLVPTVVSSHSHSKVVLTDRKLFRMHFLSGSRPLNSICIQCLWSI